jgi:hypothetical protein
MTYFTIAIQIRDLVRNMPNNVVEMSIGGTDESWTKLGQFVMSLPGYVKGKTYPLGPSMKGNLLYKVFCIVAHDSDIGGVGVSSRRCLSNMASYKSYVMIRNLIGLSSKPFQKALKSLRIASLNYC